MAGRGGARQGAGRPPSTKSLAEAVRLEAGAIRILPKARTGAAPAWPLTKATTREMVVWRRLWKKPQAVVWQEQGLDDEVAHYVRNFVVCEERDVPAARMTLLLQQRNSLFLTHGALLSAGYRISTQTTTTPADHGKPAVAKRAPIDFRGRLRAVEDVGSDA